MGSDGFGRFLIFELGSEADRVCRSGCIRCWRRAEFPPGVCARAGAKKVFKCSVANVYGGFVRVLRSVQELFEVFTGGL